MICLNALWEIQEGHVEDDRKVVAQNRPLAYTTVLTLLDRLRRGAVSRRKEGRGFRYQPTVLRRQVAAHGAAAVPRISLRRVGKKLLKIFLEQPVEAEPPVEKSSEEAMDAEPLALGMAEPLPE